MDVLHLSSSRGGRPGDGYRVHPPGDGVTRIDAARKLRPVVPEPGHCPERLVRGREPDRRDDKLADATAVLDAFHIVALAGRAVDEVRRRVQQEIHGHRGRAGDPLYGVRNILRCAAERLTEKQRARLAAAIAADERHDQVHVAWQCAQKVRAAYAHPDPSKGRELAE